MLFSYGYGQQWNQRLWKMHENWRRFGSSLRRGDTARCASPNGAHPWLYANPLDAAIGQVPARYGPGGRHGRRFWMKHKNTNKTQLLPSFLMVDQHKKAKLFKTDKSKRRIAGFRWEQKLQLDRPHPDREVVLRKTDFNFFSHLISIDRYIVGLISINMNIIWWWWRLISIKVTSFW